MMPTINGKRYVVRRRADRLTLHVRKLRALEIPDLTGQVGLQYAAQIIDWPIENVVYWQSDDHLYIDRGTGCVMVVGLAALANPPFTAVWRGVAQ